MPDTFEINATWDKPTYVKGDTMTVTFTGTGTHTTEDTTTTEAFSVDVPFTTASGAKGTVSFPGVITLPVPGTTTTEPAVIGEAVQIVDTTGRVWTVSADRHSLTGIA